MNSKDFDTRTDVYRYKTKDGNYMYFHTKPTEEELKAIKENEDLIIKTFLNKPGLIKHKIDNPEQAEHDHVSNNGQFNITGDKL